MKFRPAILVAFLLVMSQPHAHAGVAEACTVAGGVFRNAVLAQALKIAFNEEHEWEGKSFRSLPPSWKELLISDIGEFKPKLLPLVATVMKNVPDWNAQGLNGMSKARSEILRGLAATNDAYVILCIKRLEG